MEKEPQLSLISFDSETVSRHQFKKTELEDALLLERIAGGDQQAMAAIYDRYSGLVYSVAFRVLKISAEAEDVMQDVLIQVWRSPLRFVAKKGSHQRDQASHGRLRHGWLLLLDTALLTLFAAADQSSH